LLSGVMTEPQSVAEGGLQPGVDNFRALLKGHIDIIEYLNSDAATAENGEHVTGINHKPEVKMETDVIMVYGQQNPNQNMVGLIQPPNVAAHHHHQLKRNISYRPNNTRLPESPPETDSGAGSAGSPSGSDGSPYSPGYQNYNGSVIIQPPMMNAVQGQEVIQPGVILDVHNLDMPHQIPNDYMAQHVPPDRVGMNDLVNGQLNTANFYPNPTAPSVVHSPSMAPNFPSYSIPPPRNNGHHPGFVGFCRDNGIQRKRSRQDIHLSKAEPLPSPLPCVPEDGGYFEDTVSHQAIRFTEFQKEHWHNLCDANGRELSHIGLHVVADKGFNYSQFDCTFVNQKKNHFQISVHIEVRDRQAPKFVQVLTDNVVTLKQIKEFQLDFYGVKSEMPSSVVQIKQSQTDRKPVAYEPVKLDLPPNRVTKVTVARLHFSETTMNNQRKNGRPNPDQKYFYLVVALSAVTPNGEKYTILAYNSEKVIVRASNPGQFDNGETETHWQKGQVNNSIFHPGPVGVGTDRPTAALTVSGDISCTGNLYHPSDARLKQNIKEVNCAEALSRLSQIRIVQYEIRPEVSQQWQLPAEDCQRVGVIAQEVNDVLPDAVKNNGEFLTVDDSRIFYESAAAVKELCRLTGNLEYKIDEVEKISKKLSKLNKLKRFDSMRSSLSTFGEGSVLSCSLSSVMTAPSGSQAESGGVGGKLGNGYKDAKSKYSSNRDRKSYFYNKHRCGGGGGSGGGGGGGGRVAIDRGLCSNKVIQATIVVLVLVMTFCLISMATLYVLDWHKRHSMRNHDILSVSLPNRLKTEIELAATEADALPNLGLMSMQVTSAPDLQYKPDVSSSVVPLSVPCNKLPCEQFCCSNLHSSYISDHFENMHGSELPVIVLMKQKEFLPVGAYFQQNSLQTNNQILLESTTASSAKKQNDQLSTEATRRYWSTDSYRRRGFLPLYLPTFKILNLNVTIDSRYCFGHMCEDPRRGNFTYVIPVSKYMPHISLEVQFDVSDKEQMQYCSAETGEFCSGIDDAHFGDNKSINVPDIELSFATAVQQRQHDTWELPVGAYVLSAYKFRIGPSTTLCLLPEDEAGSSFVEYRLIFYRICSD
ncbi:Myelin regulatory factor-like protein, partial [Trichinella pseudospiralis]